MGAPVLQIAAGLGIAIAAALLGYFLKQYLSESKIKSAQLEAERIREEGQAQAKDITLKAKEEAIRLRDQAEVDAKRKRGNLQRQEERLQKRQDSLDRRFESLEKRERALNQRQSQMDRTRNDLEKLHKDRLAELERVSGLSRDEAKELLLQAVQEETRQDMAGVIRRVEAEAHEEADRRAREIITTAIQRVAADQVAETTVSMVPLPSDEMKGRIIGRQGRNIRAIENATGVDLIVDDTPEAVILSGFDPVRREIARIALSRLITDGRIHPARIERAVEKARQEVEEAIRAEGEQATLDAGVHGLHPEIINLLGRLKFRTSYGQNQLMHSVETAQLAGIMAAELGADVKTAKEGALLHDLGKAIDHEVNGPHATIGSEIAQRYGVRPEVVNIIASHHHEAEQQSLEAILVEAADAISGARPGARRESLETYIKRVQALEEVAHSFEGVEQAFAIQAGREIRIIVKPEQIDDYASITLSKNIARKVEDTLEYPGQIKVTVIRETRAVDYAK
jgi:ribonuclease Y